MNQKGQSLIEFALIVPTLIFLFLAIIYMGITFLDYTQYNNAARDMARDIALTNGDGGKDTLKKNINKAKSVNDTSLKPYVSPITDGFIEPKFTVSFLDSGGTEKDKAKDAINVQVKVELTVKGLPQPLKDLNVLQEKLKTLTYKMRLEKTHDYER